MKEKDIKLLWGRSGNRCAICKCELSEDKVSVNESFRTGEHAHIVGEKIGAARSISPMSDADRDGYSNRILLCPTDHTRIDSNEEDYPVEVLHKIKSDHELWVRDSLTSYLDNRAISIDLIYTNLIDSIVSCIKLYEWDIWSFSAVSPEPSWDVNANTQATKLLKKMISINWPSTNKELEHAAQTLVLSYQAAVDKFMEHAQLTTDLDRYVQTKFYRINYGETDAELFAEWEKWTEQCLSLMRLVAKSANWFADVVRRDVNPFFFATEGKFVLVEGPDMHLDMHFRLYQFTQAEKNKMPETVMKMRAKY